MICQYCGSALNTGGTCLNPACPGRLRREVMDKLMRPFDPDLAIRLSKIIHDRWTDAPHDIGAVLAQEAYTRTPAPAEVERLITKLLLAYEKFLFPYMLDDQHRFAKQYSEARKELLTALTTPATVPSEPGRYRMSVPVEISACNLPCSHGDETGCKRLLLTWPDGDVNCADAFFNGTTFTKEPV